MDNPLKRSPEWPYDQPREEAPGGDKHYRQGGIPVVRFIMSNDLTYWKGQVIKYAFRAGLKGDEVVDIEKAIFYCNERLAELGRPTWKRDT